MILAEGALARTDVACLIVGTSSKYPEARGAVNVVKAINSYMPELNIDIVPLEVSKNKQSSSVLSHFFLVQVKASQLEKSVQEILQKEKTSNSLYS